MRVRATVLFAALLLAACGDSDPFVEAPLDEVATLAIGPASATLTVGDTLRVAAYPRNENGDVLEDVAVEWTVDVPARLDLIELGQVGRTTAQQAGAVVVTATADGVSASAQISVLNPTPTVMAISPAAAPAGNPAFTLIVTGTGFTSQSRVQWNGVERPTTFVSSSEVRAAIAATDVVNEGVAAVRVTTPAPGGGATAALEFAIDADSPPPPPPPTVASVELDVDSAGVAEGATLQLHATVRDAQGNVITGLGSQWVSSVPANALVAALGLVTGIRDGRTVVTVTVHGKSDSAIIDVEADYDFDLVYTSYDAATTVATRLRHDLSTDDTDEIAVGGATTGHYAVSPDGFRVAFFGSTALQGYGLYLADLDSGALTRVAAMSDDTCGQIVWRPDGQRLAFTCGLDFGGWIVAIDAFAESLPDTLTVDQPGSDQYPAWSPQIGGEYRIAYARTVGGEPRIFTMKEDGTDHVQVTSGMDTQPSWSPDGSTIAFVRTGAAIFGDIWLVNAAGGNERGLTMLFLAGPQESPVWSPDGSLIAFLSRHDTYGGANSVNQVFTIRANGSGVARRSSGSLPKYDPSWIQR
jgi:hypothetical protein